MAFPEIRRWLKRFAPDSGEILGLDLKQAGLTFDTVSVRDANWYIRNGYPQIAAILMGGMPAWSGETVNLNSALTHSVVWACNRIISSSIGFLPALLMQDTGSGKRQVTEHPMFRAMKMAPNAEISAQAFREMLTSHCLMGGNGYAKIVRRSGTGVAMELEHLLPGQMKVDREKTGQKRLVYVVLNESGAADKTYTVQRAKPQDILHLRGIGYDGMRGYSVIEYGRQSIGSAIAAERHIAAFWKRGGRLPYVLEKGKFKNDKDYEAFRAEWQRIYSDPENVPITEGDLTYKQTGSSMRDSQATEGRQYTVSEICRWFSISPHLVQDLSRATYSNIEHLALEFVKQTLSDWLTRWESDFWRCVLTPEEQDQGYYLKHNVNALLRGDFQTRMSGYSTALQNGFKSIDEVRALEDDNPLPGGHGSHYHIQLNMQTLDSDLPSDSLWSDQNQNDGGNQGKGKSWLHRVDQ